MAGVKWSLTAPTKKYISETADLQILVVWQRFLAQSNSIWGAVMWGLWRTFGGFWRSQTPFDP